MPLVGLEPTNPRSEIAVLKTAVFTSFTTRAPNEGLAFGTSGRQPFSGFCRSRATEREPESSPSEF